MRLVGEWLSPMDLIRWSRIGPKWYGVIRYVYPTYNIRNSIKKLIGNDVDVDSLINDGCYIYGNVLLFALHYAKGDPIQHNMLYNIYLYIPTKYNLPRYPNLTQIKHILKKQKFLSKIFNEYNYFNNGDKCVTFIKGMSDTMYHIRFLKVKMFVQTEALVENRILQQDYSFKKIYYCKNKLKIFDIDGHIYRHATCDGYNYDYNNFKKYILYFNKFTLITDTIDKHKLVHRFITFLQKQNPTIQFSDSSTHVTIFFFASHASRARCPRGVARFVASLLATRPGRPFGPSGACSDLFGFFAFCFLFFVFCFK